LKLFNFGNKVELFLPMCRRRRRWSLCLNGYIGFLFVGRFDLFLSGETLCFSSAIAEAVDVVFLSTADGRVVDLSRQAIALSRLALS
jgi:hypothetical protein